MEDRIALLDLDNTLADYRGSLQQGMLALASPDEPPWVPLDRGKEPAWIKARRNLITHQAGWWRDLPPLTLGMDILDACMSIGFRVHILSKGPRHHPIAWAEKVAWVDANLPPGTPLSLSDDKSLVYGRVLADDWTPYTDPWLRARPRGLVVQPAQPWNEGLEHHPRVLRYDGTNRAAMRAALQRAYDRKSREEWTL